MAQLAPSSNMALACFESGGSGMAKAQMMIYRISPKGDPR